MQQWQKMQQKMKGILHLKQKAITNIHMAFGNAFSEIKKDFT